MRQLVFYDVTKKCQRFRKVLLHRRDPVDKHSTLLGSSGMPLLCFGHLFYFTCVSLSVGFIYRGWQDKTLMRGILDYASFRFPIYFLIIGRPFVLMSWFINEESTSINSLHFLQQCDNFESTIRS